jgi:hypothetical protein
MRWSDGRARSDRPWTELASMSKFTPEGFTLLHEAIRASQVSQTRVLQHLYKGTLQGYFIPSFGGEPREMEKEFWSSRKGTSAAQWGEAFLVFDTEPDGYASFFVKTENFLELASADPLMRIEPSATKNKASVRERRPSIGGAPKKFDATAFLIEAFKLLYQGVSPRTQAELRRCALDAYSAKFPDPADAPSEEWAKPLIRQLWNELELGNN